jgi:serine/threonine-protein kinase
MARELLGADPRFVCPSCWKIFAAGSARACPDCAGAPPAGGWPSMPCSFRGRYLLTEQLGRDAAAALFRAQNSGGAPPSAIVLLEVARSSGPLVDPSVARRLFRREATLAGLLGEESDAFLALSSIDVTDPAYIAFEHVPWPALDDVLVKEGAFPPVAAARVGASVLRGLAALERHRLVHRAVVPSRVFVHRRHDGGYDVKIAGFGAWPDGDLGAAVAPSPEILPYASPEQLRGEPLTAASDVYMVASILWQLVTGQVPWPLVEGAPPEEAAEQRLRGLACVPARPAAMPPELYDLLATALHPDAGKRAPVGSPAAGLGIALDRFADDFPRWQERELAGARRVLGATTRSLEALHARLAPLRAILEREAEIEATVQRLAADPGGPEAVREGAREAEEALAELDAEVERILSPGRASPATSALVASDPPPPEPLSAPPEAPAAKPSLPASFPPPSRRDPPDSSFPPDPSLPASFPPPSRRDPPDSLAPKAPSLPPDSLDRYDIPGVGGKRWPYAAGALLVVAVVVVVVMVTGSQGTPPPGASASASAAAVASSASASPAASSVSSGASISASPSASAGPPASASAAPAASSAPSASAAPPPARPKPRPQRSRSPDEEPTTESPPEPE